MAIKLLPGTKLWGEQVGSLALPNLIKRYEDGFAGVTPDPEKSAEFWDSIERDGGVRYGSDAASAFAGSGAGQLIATWLHVNKVFVDCWPGAAQDRGDCVSHDEKNSNIVTVACEIVAAKPDEVTGKVEGIPEIPAAGIREGAFSSAYPYWFRGYNGDGWNCDEAKAVTIKYGMLLMKPYTELGIDLTEYSGSIAGKYGARKPPENIIAEGQKHKIRTATELQSAEELRDFLANGYGVSSCGSEGYSSVRNEDGVSERKGSWAHAMAYIGFDDREETKAKYGGPLALVLNSWGKWNSGPRRVRGTTIDIPEGSFWARWKDVANRYMIAGSSAEGWPSKQLPNYEPEGF